MRYLMFNLMLFFRPFFFFVAKCLGACLFIFGLYLIIFKTSAEIQIFGAALCVCPFLLYLLRDQYDMIIFKLKPDNIRIFLNKS